MDEEHLVDRIASDEVDQILQTWRGKALGVVATVVSAVALPALLVGVWGNVIPVAWPARIAFTLVYAAPLMAALRPRWSLNVRASVLLSGLSLFCVLQLVVGQLSGNGRLSLMMLPIATLVLVGTKAGWGAALLSVALYVAGAFLVHSHAVAQWFSVGEPERAPAYWFLQGSRLAAVETVLMVLLSRLLALQRRTMVAERKTLRKLEAETADRMRLEAEVARVSEDERRRLGAELHDGLCQRLTATLLNCAAFEYRHRTADAQGVGEVARIRESIEASIGMAYDVARGLCPVDLEPDALVPALERLCQGVRDTHGVDCRLRADRGLLVNDQERALHLYRIAGEAVANAVKHARCSHIAVALAREGGQLALRVSDDGQQAEAERKTGGGLGRRIMRYRATLMGGTLDVTTPLAGGTLVICRVPEAEGDA